jgi:hypothetical protein
MKESSIVSLMEINRRSLFPKTGGFPPEVPDSMGPMIMPPQTEIFDPQKNRLKGWLDQVGLRLNPFEYIDAGKDPLIPYYLVDHDQFDKLNNDHPSFVFAPAGGGKTAFRVRLARECRAGRHGRRVFPVIYKPTMPSTLNENKEESAQRQRIELLRYASQELFLHLAYSPYVLDEMDPAVKESLLQSISWDLEFPIQYYLIEIKSAGSLEPLITEFDPTARSLPNPPGREDIEYLCEKLDRYSPGTQTPNDEKRLEILFELILDKLKFEAIYILVDGVDAFLETVNNPERSLSTISWFLENTLSWTQKRIYVKYFLAQEIRPFMKETPAFRLLTSRSEIIIIKWDADALSEVIRQRLQEASGGKFDSLAAVSDRALRASGRSLEEELIKELKRRRKLSPRSLIRSANWLLANHVQGKQAPEKLSPQDLKAVREWIRREYSAKE